MSYSSARRARHSAATVWTPHKPIFGTKRISKKNWAMEIQGLGPNSPFRAPWGPEGVIWAKPLNFHVPIFLGIRFVPNIGLWGVQTVAAECLTHPALL